MFEGLAKGRHSTDGRAKLRFSGREMCLLCLHVPSVKCGWCGDGGCWLEMVERSPNHYHVPWLGPEGHVSERTEAGI